MKKSIFKIFISLTLAILIVSSVCAGGFSAFAGTRDIDPSDLLDNSSENTSAYGIYPIGDADYSPQSDGVEQNMIDDSDALPDKIDLRDFNGKNYVTPVKLQNPYGSCWAFGIAGAAEISFLHDNDLGVPAGEVNDFVDFSEKYINWYMFHGITAEEVDTGMIRASQVGEGYDVSALEAENINAVYDFGGNGSYGVNFFASGFGPVDESTVVDGWLPYAYRGKNGWRSDDTNESAQAAAARKAYYKKQFQAQIKEFIEVGYFEREDQFDEWFDNFWHKGSGSYDFSFSSTQYAEFDDWSLPLTKEYVNPGVVSYFKNSYSLPAPAQSGDNGEYQFNEAGVAAIKLELANGHGVAVGFLADQSQPGQEAGDNGYLNTKTWAQYYNGTPEMNHEVTIVGYDDNYSKDNFTRTAGGKTVEGSTPPADGAFIVKNSWGALTEEDKATATVNGYGDIYYENPNAKAWGIDDTGYFYLSYYDHSILSACSFEFYTDDDTKYDELNYDQYDMLQTVSYDNNESETEIKAANIFDAEEDEYLIQISTMTVNPGTTVRYEIYKDVEEDNPCSGTLLEEGEGYTELSGYQRIDLDGEYFLKKGELYSVVITQSYETNDGVNYVAPYASTVSTKKGVALKGVINPGESMIYSDGEWTDLAEIKDDFLDNGYQELLEYFGSEEALLENIPDGRDGMAMDNYPIKAFLVPADVHDYKPVVGDVNRDGVVTVSDATAIQRYSVELPVEGVFDNRLADVNNDGVINILDASCVQRFAAEMTKKIGNAGKLYDDIIPTSDNPTIEL